MANKTQNAAVSNIQTQLNQLAAILADLNTSTPGDAVDRSAKQLLADIQQELEHLSQNIGRQELVLKTAAAISEAADTIVEVDALLKALVNLMQDHLGFHSVEVFLTDESREWAELRASSGNKPDQSQSSPGGRQQRVKIDDPSTIGRTIRQQQPHRVSEVQPESGALEGQKPAVIQSEIVLPLANQGQVIGALSIRSTAPDTFSEDDLPLLQTLANQVANAIQNASLFAIVDRQLEQLVTLHNINLQIGSHPDFETLFDDVAQLSATLMGADCAIVRMADKNENRLTIKATYTPPKNISLGQSETLDTGLSRRVVQTQQPILANDWPNHPLATEYGSKSTSQLLAILNVPIAMQNKVIGTIEVQSFTQAQAFDEGDLYLLSLMAAQAAIVIENTRLFDEAENSRRFLKAVIEHIPDPIFIKDENHTLLEMNQANADVIGQPAAELIGKTEHDFFPADLADEFHRRDDEVFTTNEIVIVEDTTVWADGREHTAYTRLIPIADVANGRPKYLLGITHDISERKAHEAERERLLAETAALYSGSQAIASASNERQIFEAVFDQIRLQAPCEISAYRFERVGAEPLWAELKAGWQKKNNPSEPVGSRFYLPETAQARLLTTAEPLFIEDMATDDRLSAPERESFAPTGARSLAILPLASGGHKLGAILIYFTQPYTFTETTKRFWLAMVDQARVALTNLRLIQEATYRAVQMEAAAQVARAASSMLDLNELLNTTVELIRDRFDLYYVGAFLIDPPSTPPDAGGVEGGWAVLRAGTGEAGRIQLKKGHRLKIGGESMIGWSVHHRTARIALDVGQDAVHFQNPYLPNTHSEIALPLISRDEVIGALTVQSEKRGAFSDEDVTVLQTMADQLANALQNARLFENAVNAQQAAETRLQETQALQRLSRSLAGTLQVNEILELFFEACTKVIGFEYVQFSMVDKYQHRVSAVAGVGVTDSQIKRADHSLDSNDIMADIVRTGHTEVITGWDDRFDKETFEVEGHADWVRVFTPITLQQENIGLVEAGYNKNRRATIQDAQIRLLRAFIDQTALALDNAQRYEASQRAARREALIKEITTQVSETIDLRQIYDILTTQIIGYLNADTCSVSLLNKVRTHFEVIVEQSRNEAGEITASTQPWTDAIDDYARLQQMVKRPEVSIVHLNDPALDANSRQYMERRAGKKIRTLATFPLVVRNNLVGILEVGHNHEQRDYSQNELQLAQAIISRVAVAIENAQLFQRTETALSETQKLYNISRALVESNDLDDIFEVVIQNVKAFGIDRVSISLLDRTESGEIDTVTIAASWDRDSDKILPVGSKISSDRFSLVHTFAQPPFYPLISEDLSRPEGQDERMDDAFRRFMYEGLGAITLFSTAMFLGTEYKGVLSISTRKPHTYSEQEIRIYQTLADQAIIAIENRRLFEAIRRERDQAGLLYEIGRALSQATTIDEVKDTVLSFIQRAGAVHGEIYITDGEGFLTMGSTIPERQSLSPDQANELTKLVLSQGPGAEALRQHKALLKNSSGEKREDVEGGAVDQDQSWMQSVVSTPFHSRRSKLQGVLTFFHPAENGFTPDHISVFESIASQTEATLENIRLLQQTATVLSETEVLYKASRDFNGAQHHEELLAILAESFVSAGPQMEAGVDFMSIALVSALTDEGTLSGLDILATWDRQRSAKAEPDSFAIEIIPENFSFIPQINPGGPVTVYRDSLDLATQANIDECFGGSRTILCIPLTVGTNWLGVLFVGSRTEGLVFKPNVLNQLITLTGQVAVVVQNLQLVEETQQNLYNSEILSHLTQELLVADTAETIYTFSLEAIAATEPGRGAAIFMYDEIEGEIELEMVAVWDNPNQEWPVIAPGARFSAEELGLVPLLKTGQTVTAYNVTEDDRFSDLLRQLLDVLQINSLVAVPVWLNQEVNGFILIGNQEPTTYSADTLRLYEDIARQTSGALENRRLLEEARHRARLLQTAAEVSQAATSYLELDTLLPQAVNLIRSRFGYYHVSIFLVDEYQKYAVVEASTGEIGQQMLAMKHKLAVGGKSIVGTATGTAKPRIALDVGKDAVHFNNPLLPKTRSEMALPLIAQGRVIGALDVQSTKRGAFTETDITILQSMANQLANAIEAARSYQESQKALEEVRKLHEYYLREQWASFLREQKAISGYRLTEDGLVPTHEDTGLPEISQATGSKRPVLIPATTPSANGEDQVEAPRPADSSETGQTRVSTPPDTDGAATLVAPLSLQNDVVIGALDFEVSNRDEIWEADNLEIIEAVTAQAAQAIEAARLFEQTQAAREEARQRALQLQTSADVGRVVTSILDQDLMLREAVELIRDRFGLYHAQVFLIDADQQFAVLHESTGQAGQKLLASHYKVAIGSQSVIGQSTYQRKSFVVRDSDSGDRAPLRHHNEFLPDTKAELAIPLQVGTYLIGVLDVHSTSPNAFTREETATLETLAAQLAIAIQNARAFRRQQETAQRLKEIDKLKTQFLANMSHELRTPLNSIIGFSRVILKGIDGPLTELQKADLTSIHNSGQHLLSLINNILDLSKIEAGKMELNFEEIEVAPIIKSVTSTAIALVKDKPVELVQEIPDDLPLVWADQTRIRQVILNLVSNACKFTNEGTVTLRVFADNDKLTISVSDTGIGIPEDKLEHIFEEFVQVDASTTRKVGGTGLGLPISRHFVEMHRGQIWVESKPGQGSIFSFAIPLKQVDDALAQLDALITDNKKDGEGKLIIAIDDDPRVITLYERFLERQGYQVIGINDSNNVIPQIKQYNPFAILLDILMPEKDGWGVLKELKNDPFTKDIPVIICSIISDKNRGFSLGAADYLTKPIVESELIKALKHLDGQEKEEVKVLVVDDQADDILLIRRILEAQPNYSILEARNGIEGLELVKSKNPDLIILDLSMPEMDGFTVVEALKNNANTRAIPIIIVSAIDLTPKEHQFLTGQVEVLLRKGLFTENELLEDVSQALKRVHYREMI